ncbi:hypothetical protein [Paenibacillus xanthanilyticus]|uniref:Uncharacterized protein n=1 Tax=Paenibacillus xanthanilyticus TaxID=1783531 RepID=A0ABV8K0N5_9BACL
MWYDPYASGYAPDGSAGAPLARAGGDCGCGGPRALTQHPVPPGPGPGLIGPGHGPGLFPPHHGPGPFPPPPGPGPGPWPPGPGPFPPPPPPGPGPWPPGPGPFPPPPPPGPGPWPPGPGPFPPPPPPGPGPWPPGPGPWPPGPGPWPIPFPLPIPTPLPPFPGNFVTVVLNGGTAFPWVTNSYRVPHFPGQTVYQALAATGAVRFGPSGRIVAVGGVSTGEGVLVQLLLNGRRIPQSLLSFPVQAGDAVAVQLYLGGPGSLPREDYAQPVSNEVYTNPLLPGAYGEYRTDNEEANEG